MATFQSILLGFLSYFALVVHSFHPMTSMSYDPMIPKAFKKISKLILPVSVGGIILTIQPVMASETPDINIISKGSQIFSQSCVMCHAQGGNVIAKQRDLSKEAIDQYIGLDIQAIKRFIHDSNVHRGALAFSAKLTDADYDNVAAYVYNQAMESKW